MVEFLERQKNKTLPLVVDVRQPDEWEEGHIPDAMHIPMGEIADTIEATVPEKSQEFIIYCASGGRSRRVVEALHAAGYLNAYNLEGGFFVYQMHTL